MFPPNWLKRSGDFFLPCRLLNHELASVASLRRNS